MLTTLFALVPLATAAFDSPGPNWTTYENASDPYVVRDAARRFEAAVEPALPRLDRPCRVTVRSDGKEMWSAEFPCVWRDTAVAPDGTSVGWGLETTADPEGKPVSARVHLWIVAPDGKRRASTTWECVTRYRNRETNEMCAIPGAFASEDPPPRVLGTVLDAANDRWLVRVHTPWNTVEWHWLRVSTGVEYAKHVVVDPGPVQTRSVRATEEMAPVAGTQWLLARRRTWDYEQGVDRHVFELVDEKGASWWSIALGRARRSGERDASIVRCDESRRFDVTFGGADPVRRFEIVADATSSNGHGVRELEVAAPLAPQPVVETTKCRLEVVARTPLQGIAKTGPWLDADAVAFDDRARVGVLQQQAGGALQFVLSERDGTELTRFDLGRGAQGYDASLVWIADDRWIATVEDETGDIVKNARWIDVSERTAARVPQLEGFDVVVVQRTPDGGFVATVHDGEARVVAFDVAGQLAWSVASTEDSSFAAATLAVDARGRTALLGNSHLFVLDAEGKLAESIDLTALFGGDVSYIDASAHPDGGWLVVGYDERHVFRVDANGRAGPAFTPKRRDGVAFARTDEPPLRAPDGSLWWHEGAALVPLDATGTARGADGVFDGADLHACGPATFDDAGRLYVVDAQSQRVHVYDEKGRRTALLDAVPRSGGEARPAHRIRASSAGRVHVNVWDECGDAGLWIELDTPAKRAGPAFVLDARARDVQFTRGGEDAWSLLTDGECDVAVRTAPDGKVMARIDRRPDRSWFDSPSAVRVLADSGVVVVDDEGFHAFRADGAARASIVASLYTEYAAASARRWITGFGAFVTFVDVLDSGTRVRAGEIPIDTDFEGAAVRVRDDGELRVFVPSLREILSVRVRD